MVVNPPPAAPKPRPPARRPASASIPRFAPRAMIAFGVPMSLTTAIHAPRGSALSCKGWHQEAAFRMIQNNLDPDVAENPDELIVYGGRGRAARDWPSFHAILRALRSLENEEHTSEL